MGLISIGSGRSIALKMLAPKLIASVRKNMTLTGIELNKIILIFILWLASVKTLLGFAYGFGILMQTSKN